MVIPAREMYGNPIYKLMQKKTAFGPFGVLVGKYFVGCCNHCCIELPGSDIYFFLRKSTGQCTLIGVHQVTG